MGEDDARNPVERLVPAGLDEDVGLRKPLSRRARQRSRALEDYLKAGGPPRGMERIGQIDPGIARGRRRPERECRALRRTYVRDRSAFARAWRARAQAQR